MDTPALDGFFKIGGDLPHTIQDCYLALRDGKISGQAGYARFEGAFTQDAGTIRGHYTATQRSAQAEGHHARSVTLEFAGTLANGVVRARAWFAGQPRSRFDLILKAVGQARSNVEPLDWKGIAILSRNAISAHAHHA